MTNIPENLSGTVTSKSPINDETLDNIGNPIQLRETSFNKYGFVHQLNSTKSNSDRISIKSYRSRYSIRSNHRLLSFDERLKTENIDEFAVNHPAKTIRSRELKWIEMLKYDLTEYKISSAKNRKRLKERCRKGIPQSLRSQAWMQLSGALKLKQARPSYYSDCLKNSANINIIGVTDEIRRDLHRQFPNHELLMRPEGQDMLYNILKAYAVHCPEIGYCQAQCPLAALLITQMPEEDAFWMLIKISDEYLQGYFSNGLVTVKTDCQILHYLFSQEDKYIFKTFSKLELEPQFYMIEWFMCVYIRTLPWCTVLRIWDMFLYEGKIILFKVAIYLVRFAFKDRTMLRAKSAEGLVEVLEMLKNSMTVESLKEENFAKEVNAIDVTYEDISYFKLKILGKNFYPK